jgi:hypothetical protein
MTISLNAALAEQTKIVMGCAPATLATTAGDGDYVSMKNYRRCTIIVPVLNATTVTGGVITLLQATDVAASGAKELALTRMWANTDCAASDTLTKTAVTSNTFTTSTTNSKILLYVIEVLSEDLDVAGGFDCIRIDSASMANAVGAAIYILDGSRYGGTTPPAAITD